MECRMMLVKRMRKQILMLSGTTYCTESSASQQTKADNTMADLSSTPSFSGVLLRILRAVPATSFFVLGR
jgi:hypothetical protein